MDRDVLRRFVNAFGGGVKEVSASLGVQAELQKKGIRQGVEVTGSRVAALVGVVGGEIHGTAAIMLDQQGFEAYVTGMSGGMVQPDMEDPVALSVVGELANMSSGKTLTKLDIKGLDLTPPQIITGENVKAVPAEKLGVISFTLPFTVGDEGKVFLVLSFNQ
ncbi:MAG: chemotaxis protein CheX [Synergistales bacterium]|nr:chemotaxis protein CheX [Synergistales bacterium]